MSDVSVVVPTYRRPEQLRRCLAGLRAQDLKPRQIVVVRRAGDDETASVLREWHDDGVSDVTVAEGGVVGALAAGMRAATADVVAFTDDDAVPRPDWLARIEAHLRDPSVGGVGGRDLIHGGAPKGRREVGRVTPWGKVIGNHHVGIGPPRDAMILKGTNMAFRRQAIALPAGLRGSGAQVHYEVAMCLWARRRGWRLVYDPRIVVDHFPGPRFDADRRGRPEQRAIQDASYNLVACLLANEPELFLRRASYGLLVGDGGNPGLARGAAGVVRGEVEIVRRLAPSLAGQVRALTDFVLERGVEMRPIGEPEKRGRRLEHGAEGGAARMKVVFTVPWGERLGGAENMLWTFLQRVDRGSLEPIVVFLAHGPFPREVAAHGIRTIVLPAGRLRDVPTALRVVGSLTRVLRREEPDLLVNWMSKTHLYGAPAAALAGMRDRVVWWQHGIPSGHWMDRLATVLPARAVGCSSRTSAGAQKRLWPGRQTFVVHPGIEEPPPAAAKERLAVRRRLGVPAGSALVGIVGRLQPWKGHDRFLRALAMLQQRGVSVHGLVVGGDAHGRSPGYGRSLQRLVDELSLSNAVTFTGHVPDAVPYIAAMDVLVNASREEPFGIVLLEAMAVGTAVVAVDGAGPSEIVEPGTTGVLVRTTDERALADAVAALLEDPVLRRRLAEAGVRRFGARFTAAQTAERLVDAFTVFCNDSGRVPSSR